ncbi:galactose-1-phosphate uridyl transferase [Catenaria anguillulae PL171]|uniref:Galactose-1-phosphate uridylyltransferase n=1 Tax=Catenaria anguillulae PL171 TaxID=765915 RepID=A0A1Y2HTB6_9FUNG|nr:galactose-1-phosphate uridyl transferase [Catenaria anguillulae PL171]
MSHRRRNPLTGEWVVCSPHRTQRPWKGASETPPAHTQTEYDPTCALCPGNQRSGGANPDYTDNWLFQNDFAALRESSPAANPPLAASATAPASSSLFQSAPADGKCIVHCFSRRHDLTFADLPLDQVTGVLATWRAAWARLVGVALPGVPVPNESEAADPLAQSESVTWPIPDGPHFEHALVFENKGAMMGCSMPHPHCQIWASQFVPTVVATELANMAAFRRERGGDDDNVCCMLCEYAQKEVELGERVVVQNTQFMAVVPYWATWPFEVLVLPKTHVANLAELAAADLGLLAEVMSAVTRAYDALFQCSFPYSMGFHQDKQPTPMHLHAHFYPPLLRSATVRKFLVGFEMLGEAQRDLTPEDAAKRLRELVVQQ